MRQRSSPPPLRRLCCVTVFLASMNLLPGQESRPGAPGDVRFSVASIRPGDPNGLMSGPPRRPSPGRFTAEAATQVSLAMRAFGLKQPLQIEYPSWMLSAHFNVNAAFPEGATEKDLPLMIRHLLEDRFELVFHRETRTMAGYDLVIAKSRAKVERSAPGAPPAASGSAIEMNHGVPQFTKDAGSGQLLLAATMTAIWRGRNKSMTDLAVDLANELRTPVRDATGLEGAYDYTLTFTPEPKAAAGTVVSPPIAPGNRDLHDEARAAQPLLRDALQAQLGLRLQAVKNVRVDVIVLDSARRTPTEN